MHTCSVVSDFCDPLDCSPPGSSFRGIFQARIVEWVAVSYSRRSSWPRDLTHISRVSCLEANSLHRATWKAPRMKRGAVHYTGQGGQNHANFAGAKFREAFGY